MNNINEKTVFKDETPTFLPSNEKKQGLTKYSSEPKFRSLKQQILKIPKVKQILQKDKFLYNQDIQKRLQLIGSVKNDAYQEKQIIDLHQLRKSVTKKSKRHKTNFKIPLTRNNVHSLNNLITQHISQNKKFKNQEVIFLKQYTQNAPFDLEKLKFMDDINPLKKKYKEKFPQFTQGILMKNKLLLEHVILNRNLKREMKMDQKKTIKQHAKNVFNAIK